MQRIRFAIAFGAALFVAAPSAQAQLRRTSNVNVGGYPTAESVPAGMCQIWINGLPASRQPAPMNCDTARRNAPPNSRIIYGRATGTGSYDPRRDPRSPSYDPRYDPRNRGNSEWERKREKEREKYQRKLQKQREKEWKKASRNRDRDDDDDRRDGRRGQNGQYGQHGQYGRRDNDDDRRYGQTDRNGGNGRSDAVLTPTGRVRFP